MTRVLLGVMVLLLAGISTRAQADRVTVFAAASLKTALSDIARSFENETGHSVILSFAGSSALARQIELGAPADIFVSANPGWMDHLESRGLIVPGTRRDMASNRLVLIAHDAGPAPATFSADFDLPGRLGDGYLAMALVDAVPAGIYGKAALIHFGLWDAVAMRVAQTDNVRAALALVALGETPFGITYVTDAIADPRVHVAAIFPPDSHPSIRYPAAVIAGRDSAATRAFLDHLHGPAARAILEQTGFEAPR